MMASLLFVFPGDSIPAEILPTSSNPSVALKLGPGLRHIPPETITAQVAGEVYIDTKKNAVWIEGSNGRVSRHSLTIRFISNSVLCQYIPTQGDQIIAAVHHSSAETYHCAITPHTSFAQLGQLAFEGASKKTRPQLGPGALVYARISLANKHMDPELECVNPSTGKSDGLGELKGGMVFDISMVMARRLMMKDPGKQGGVIVLEDLADKIPYEMAVGRNGKVWVDSGSIKSTLAVGKAIVDTDKLSLSPADQRALVKKLLRAL
jgi:exosome complex component RRP40